MLQTNDIILSIFLKVSDSLKDMDFKHPQAKLYLSEIVTIGILWVLKGIPFRRFYRWLKREKYIPNLPERSRMSRLLSTHHSVCNKFLDSPTFFNILDSYGIELIHPVRERQYKKKYHPLAKKGVSNYRWIVGRKLAVSLNGNLKITKYDENTANVFDNTFNETFTDDSFINLTDKGFVKRNNTPANFKICKRGSWNERMCIERLFSLWTRICNLKHSLHRTLKGFQTKMAYTVALTNVIVNLNNQLQFNPATLVQWSI